MIDLLDVEKAKPQGKLLTIAKFAKLAGLPVSTIRYWMKEGKIKPITYTASGYAMFDENQVAEIKKDQLNFLQIWYLFWEMGKNKKQIRDQTTAQMHQYSEDIENRKVPENKGYRGNILS